MLERAKQIKLGRKDSDFFFFFFFSGLGAFLWIRMVGKIPILIQTHRGYNQTSYYSY